MKIEMYENNFLMQEKCWMPCWQQVNLQTWHTHISNECQIVEMVVRVF